MKVEYNNYQNKDLSFIQKLDSVSNRSSTLIAKKNTEPLSRNSEYRPRNSMHSLWKNVPQIRYLEDENKIAEVAELLGISRDEVKNMPLEMDPKPIIKLLPTYVELWNLLMRMYLLGNVDLAI